MFEHALTFFDHIRRLCEREIFILNLTIAKIIAQLCPTSNTRHMIHLQDYVRADELEWADALGQQWVASDRSAEGRAFQQTTVLLARAWMKRELLEENLRKAGLVFFFLGPN